MARSVVAADLLLSSSLSQPCLPETTRNIAADPWSGKKRIVERGERIEDRKKMTNEK